jgi:hypothetical protein
MFFGFAVALFYLLRRTFFWLFFGALWLLTFIFLIAHIILLKKYIFSLTLLKDLCKEKTNPIFLPSKSSSFSDEYNAKAKKGYGCKGKKFIRSSGA